MAVEAVGDRLYAVGAGVLSVLDISKPEAPRVLGALPGLGTTRQIFVAGGLAYVTARQDGLWIIDVSEPSSPGILSHYDTIEMATGIWVSGGIGFIATRCYGVEIVDVSDPRRVRHLSVLKTGEAQSCWARDGFLYIGDWAPRKLRVADVRDPLRPVLVGKGDLDGYGDGGCLRGSLCYAATGHHARGPGRAEAEGHGHGLEIFDVSDPARPVFRSRVKFPSGYTIHNDMWAARVAGDHCVVADTWNGVFVVNVRDASAPAIVARAELPEAPREKRPDPVGGVAMAEGVIYAAGIYTGLYVIPAPGLAHPVAREPDRATAVPPAAEEPASDPDFLVYRPGGQVRAVAVAGDMAWVAGGAAGLHAVRLGAELTRAGAWILSNDVVHVSLCKDLLFTSEGAAGAGIHRIGAGPARTEVGRLSIPRQGIRQVTVPEPGGYALVHCGGATVYVADVRNPAAPRIVLKDSQVGLFYGDQLVDQRLGGRFLVAYWSRGGPAWYDVGGGEPVHAGNTPDATTYSWTDGACALGDRLLLVQGGDYRLLDPGETRPASSLPAHRVEGMRLAGRPSTDGRRLAVASRHARRVSVVDIRHPGRPTPEREYVLSGHPGACAFWNGRLVIPAAYQGLLVERPR